MAPWQRSKQNVPESGERSSAPGPQPERAEHPRDEYAQHDAPVYRGSGAAVRGGVSIGAVLTGVLVAFGTMLILSAIAAGVIAALNLDGGDVNTGNAREMGIGAALIFVIAQFLSYLWGGYAAGRMARGAGVLNGLLVPITGLVIAGLTVAVVTMLGAEADLNAPFATRTLNIDQETALTFGIGAGVATLLGMLLGGMLGGMLGARWHTKLEDRELVDNQRMAA